MPVCPELNDSDGFDLAHLQRRRDVILDPAANAFAVEAAAMALADACLQVIYQRLDKVLHFSHFTPQDSCRQCCLDLSCAAALVARMSSPTCLLMGKDSTRLTSRLANAAAVIASTSDRGRSQLLQVSA